jgi:hypothetical protein
MSTHHLTVPSSSAVPLPCGFQNAVLTRIGAAMDALASLADMAESLRHPDLQKIADDAFNALQDAKLASQRYTGPTFTCENCKAGFRGDGRYYPGSPIANQPRMDHVCQLCERILMDASARALTAAPPCQDCGKGKAVFPQTGRCWPCHDKAERTPALASFAGMSPIGLKSEPAPPTQLPTPQPTVSALGYEMLARAAKARIMAKLLTGGGVSAASAATMTSADWQCFHSGLVSKGILGPHSTTPSAETIERTLAEMRAMESSARACRSLTGMSTMVDKLSATFAAPRIAARGYAMIAPGIAVRTRRRIA